MIDRETFDLIKRKHGAYASWAVWPEPTGGPKSDIGDLSVLDPDQNPRLLPTLRSNVVMLALNLSRDVPPPLGNFHDPRPVAQDYKIRYAFSRTPFYGAYMTDLIKRVVMLKSGNLLSHLTHNPSLVSESMQILLEEFDDLRCASPTVIAFGATVHRLALEHVPSSSYSRLVRVMHYSDYVSKETYRQRVSEALA